MFNGEKFQKFPKMAKYLRFFRDFIKNPKSNVRISFMKFFIFNYDFFHVSFGVGFPSIGFQNSFRNIQIQIFNFLISNGRSYRYKVAHIIMLGRPWMAGRQSSKKIGKIVNFLKKMLWGSEILYKKSPLHFKA